MQNGKSNKQERREEKIKKIFCIFFEWVSVLVIVSLFICQMFAWNLQMILDHSAVCSCVLHTFANDICFILFCFVLLFFSLSPRHWIGSTFFSHSLVRLSVLVGLYCMQYCNYNCRNSCEYFVVSSVARMDAHIKWRRTKKQQYIKACTKCLQLTVMSDVKSSVCVPWIFGIHFSL